MAKEITREELRELLRPYWRMRKWAKHQKPNKAIESSSMAHSINENWYGNYCALCGLYFNRFSHKCGECPLILNGCSCGKPGGIWSRLHFAQTWSEWIKACNAMARTLMKLPRAKVPCPECGGHGDVECNHASHHIETMSCCDVSNCHNGWVTCDNCDGEGEINAR